MSNRLAATRGATRRRRSWTAFWIISILGLAAGVAWAYESGVRSSLAPIVLGGLVVIGLAAALFGSMLSPNRDQAGLYATQGLGSGGIGAVGTFDGGGSAGGDGGAC